MPVSISQKTFTGGEWSPSLDPRTDLAKYATAVKTMRNMHPLAHGGAQNRGGLEFTARLKQMNKRGELIPFQFSTVQSYVLAFEDQVLRFIKDGGIITLSPQALTAATQANPVVVTYSGADTYSNGDRVIISGVRGMVELNNREFTVANVNTGANTFELSGIDGTGYSAYVSGGSVAEIYQITTPYLEADLPLLKWSQSADTVYLTHPSYARRKLTRTAHTSWTLSTITSGSSQAAPTGLTTSGGSTNTYAVTAINADGVESFPSVSVASGNTSTLSWTAASGAVSYSVYQLVNGIYQFIGDAIGTSFVLTASMTADPDYAAPKSDDPMGTTDGANTNPGCSAMFKQRLLYGRTNNRPQSIYGSRVGDFDNNGVSTPVADDDAYIITLDSDQVNEIRWMARLNDLIIGTSGTEHRMAPGENTPTSLKITDQSAWGVAHILPIKIGSSLIFVDASRRRVRDLTFSFAIDGYEGNDMTILAQHLFEDSQIRRWTFARQPDSIVWTVREDGIACGLTYNKEHQVNGWHRHDTDGLFESVAAIQTTDDTWEVYFIVKRETDEGTVRYIERLRVRDFTDIEDAFFVDSGLTYDGSVAATLTPGAGAATQGTTGVTFTVGSSVFVSTDVGRYIHYRRFTGLYDANQIPLYLTSRALITGYTSGTVVTATIIDAWPDLDVIASGDWRMSTTTISGLGHLEGKQVVLLADGNVDKDEDGLVVTNGKITLTNPASKVQVGLPYTCDLWTLGFSYPARDGVIEDRQRDVSLVTVFLTKSRELYVGPDADHLIEAKFRTNENYGDPTRLFTGPKDVSIPPGNLSDARVFVRVLDPVPITVSAVVPRVDAGRI